MIYFVLIDRFANGDRSNDDFKKGEYNPNDDNCFQGGDLRGLINRLPYIKRLGFDALWISPPVYNQWIQQGIACRGYHGYWAYDFEAIDPHFGTLEDYRELVRKAHRLGIRVIQDIVLNHTGNFFTVDMEKYDPKNPARGWRELPKGYPPEPGKSIAPNDPVFKMNNPNIPEHRRAGVYNFTPNITDFNDRQQALKYTFADLDDVNLNSKLAAKRMREIYRYWIDAVGVDGYRIDSVLYTPEKFYEEFLHSKRRNDFGIKPFAAKNGIGDFFVFAETWSYDFDLLNGYLKGKTGRRRIDSNLDFPLNEAFSKVFFAKGPTNDLATCLNAKRLNRPLWVNFVDNHDMERVYHRADWRSIQQALVALFTLPGIPCIYSGTEVGFKKTRQNMFAKKYLAQKSREAIFLKKCIRLRRSVSDFANARLNIIQDSFKSGILAYSSGSTVTVFNTSEDRMLFSLPTATTYKSLLSSEEVKSVDSQLILPPESFFVLKKTSTARATRAKRISRPVLRLPSGPLRGSIPVGISLSGQFQKLLLLTNDNFSNAISVSPAQRSFAFDSNRLGNGHHTIRLWAQAENGAVACSKPVNLWINNPYRKLVSAKAPTLRKDAQGRSLGGLAQNICLPFHPTYRDQPEIRSATLLQSGGALRLTLRMKSISRVWNPPNQFDHVYFNVFFDIPDAGDSKPFLPFLDYCPPNFRFSLGCLFYGWGRAIYLSAGAKRNAYGTPIKRNVGIHVDQDARDISFDFPVGFFPKTASFKGWKVFVCTWDGDGGKLHDVASERADHKFYVLDGKTKNVPKIYSSILLNA